MWTFWSLIVSGAGVAITALGTSFLLWQILLTRQAVNDTSKATGAMLEQNKISEKYAKAQIRAYVVTGLPTGSFKEDGTFVGQIKIINTGETAANNIRVFFQAVVMIVDPTQTPPVRFIPSKNYFLPDFALIRGGDKAVDIYVPPFDTKTTESFKRGQASYSLVIWIAYQDIFKDWQTEETGFTVRALDAKRTATFDSDPVQINTVSSPIEHLKKQG